MMTSKMRVPTRLITSDVRQPIRFEKKNILALAGFFDRREGPAVGGLPARVAIGRSHAAREAFAFQALVPFGDQRAEIVHRILHSDDAARLSGITKVTAPRSSEEWQLSTQR